MKFRIYSDGSIGVVSSESILSFDHPRVIAAGDEYTEYDVPDEIVEHLANHYWCYT